jgi:GT2 family glycosyltransferase
MGVSVLVIIVNYNNSKKSIECVSSLIDQDKLERLSIHIVDNGSIESEMSLLKNNFSKSNYINSSINLHFLHENVGYFPAISKIYNELSIDGFDFDYLIIGNNDLKFSINFIHKLSEKKYDESVFVISPDIINSDGTHQNPQVLIKYSSLQLLFLEFYHFHYFFAYAISLVSKFLKFRTSQNNKQGYDKSQFISIGYGACYILTKNYLKNVGFIPSYLFLMNEENALSDIVFKNNGRIYYDNSLIIYHLEHSSINSVPKRKMYDIVQKSYKISKLHFNNKNLFDKQLINL